MKKLPSLILAVMMLTSVLVVPVYADGDDTFNDSRFGERPEDGDTPVEPPNEFKEAATDKYGKTVQSKTMILKKK